ncbi:MAG: hypothetical protein KZQ77_00275, partial [Candidatus Thiodiazotropha sp. (ex Notomyrtea botanica)]|nr:hypothetical protein [Candidatus Thiodiazotropha sp. (ex Notomyrtea botanica)]
MKHELVSIRRKKIDSNKIQGFVLDESDKLILLAYIYDFNADGLMVLRKKDISEMKASKTDKFQTQLLQDEGVSEKIDFDAKYNLGSWRKFFVSAKIKHRYFIVEQELLKEPDFAIGTIESIEKSNLTFRYFTGIARWLDDLEKIEYLNITSCQIGNNYLNVYERYFQRQIA